MLRGLFVLLCFVTEREVLIELVRCAWRFALFNVGMLAVIGAIAAVRRMAGKHTPA